MSYVETPPVETQAKPESYLQKNALQFTVQVVGVIVLILNLWLASKLAPLAEDIRILKLQTGTVEAKMTTFESKIVTVDVLNAQMEGLQGDMRDIKDSMFRLEDRLLAK